MSTKSFFNFVSLVVGLLIFIIGLLNLFRGNDPVLGIAFMTLSFIYLPTTNKLLKDKTGISIHYLLKIFIAFVFLWIVMSVGAIAEGYYPEII